MSSGTFKQRVFTCPACSQPVIGRFSYGIEIDPGEAIAKVDDELRLPVSIAVTGLQVTHDCIPKMIR